MERKVLIVDDDRLDRTILTRRLAGHCHVDVAEDGKDGIKRFKQSLDAQEPYQAVVMDISMPRLGGVEAAEGIRRLEKSYGVPPGREARILFLTMHDDPRSAVRAFFKGEADAYITKPVIERLDAIVAAIMAPERHAGDGASRPRTSDRKCGCLRGE